jgi:hypothetical protein
VLDRALTHRDGTLRPAPRWLPPAVGVLLALGAISDPMVVYVGCVPLVLVCALRLWRSGTRRSAQRLMRTTWRHAEARLIVAAVASVAVMRLVLLLHRLLGGAYVHGVNAGFARPPRLVENISIAADSLSADFGGYFPDRGVGLETVMGAVRLGGLFLTAAVVGIVIVRLLRRRLGTRASVVDELLAVAVAVNVVALFVSTIPVDASSARQVAPVLFLGAAAVGRFLGPLLTVARPAWLTPARWMPLGAVFALVVAVDFVAGLTTPAVPHENHEVAEFLQSRHLTYGLGNFWTANNITLQTGGAIAVIPVTGDSRVEGLRWLSKKDWYDATKHDARFVVIRRNQPTYGTEAGTIAQFGQPVEREELGGIVVFIYDRNLLVGLPAQCMPVIAASMADCD